MAKKITLTIPGVDSNDLDQTEAVHNAMMRLRDMSPRTQVELNGTGGLFAPEHDTPQVYNITTVCPDAAYDEDVVMSIHSYLVTRIEVPSGVSIETSVRSVDSHFIG